MQKDFVRTAAADLDIYMEVILNTAKEMEPFKSMGLPDAQLKEVISACVLSFERALVEIGQHFKKNLPSTAPLRYRDHFKRMRDEYREDFITRHGRKPIRGNDKEDFTAASFFHKVWGQYIAAGIIHGKYLQSVDPELYRALADYVRGSNEGRCGREPTNFRLLGIRSQAQVFERVCPLEIAPEHPQNILNTLPKPAP